MSQEQQPIRSRRELRKARNEALAKNRNAAPPGAGESAPASKPPAAKGPAANPPASKRPGAPGPGTSAPAGPEKTDSSRASEGNRQETATGRVRRVAPGPVDSPPAGSAAERSSQIRARDRAALRTIKELAEKEEQLSGGGPPTRRQLRLMQLKEQAITSAMPVVPLADGDAPTGKSPASPAGASPDGSSSGTRGKPAPATGSKPAGQPSSGQPSNGQGPRPAAPAGDELPDGMTVEQALEARGRMGPFLLYIRNVHSWRPASPFPSHVLPCTHYLTSGCSCSTRCLRCLSTARTGYRSFPGLRISKMRDSA